MTERTRQIRELCAMLADEKVWGEIDPFVELLACCIVPELCNTIEKLEHQIDEFIADNKDWWLMQAMKGGGRG